MLKMNRKLSKKGFSLIELMVAVAILAMAIFGIFNAFSSGWMGMANARDRTVATNYAQEILEDIKNTPFEKIHSESTSQIDDTKFSRNISLSPNTNPNIKEVTAQVTWKNWRGSVKNVEASTLIYGQFSSEQTSEAVALVLYAQPYHNILPGSSETMLTALVKDVNGNLVTDWGKDIFFSIPVEPVDYSGMGTVPTIGFPPNQGKVTGVFFTSSGEFGEAVIVASSEGLRNDSVTLKITDKAIAIKLEADPVKIFTGGQSTINVSLLDANYDDLFLPEGAIDEHLITFNVIDGPGTITGPISVLLNSVNGGINSTTLTSTGTPGIVTIIASSMGLESGVINVPILGSAVSISITAIPSSILLGGNTEITVTIKDSAGNSVLYSGIINLSLSDPDNGSLTGEYYNEETGELTFSDESSKTITYTPSDAGEMNITALSVELSSQDIVTIYISKGLKIKLSAEPEIIIADGEDSSTITATIFDVNNVIVTDEIYQIIFAITSGEGILLGNNLQETVNGEATISLISISEPGIITVSARAIDLTPDSVTVQTIYPKFIFLSADSSWLYIGGETNISITVENSEGEPADYFETINLTLSDSGSGNINPETLDYTTQQNAIFTALSAGEVTIAADGDGINPDLITIQILKKGEALTLVTDSIAISDGGKTITFEISNDGSVVGLEILRMQVTWDSPSSYLGQIYIDPNSVYNNGSASSEDIIDIIDTFLPFGTSTIGLYFSEPMYGEFITVTFFDSDSGYGPLEFTVIP